jgi:hypothetical protein
MTQQSFDFHRQKGEYAERIIKTMLESKGYVVYMPCTDGAHAFDIMAIKDKSCCVALDIKAKARMNNLLATGVNQSSYDTYKEFSHRHNMPFWIVFVDEMEKRIYGNTIDELDKDYEDLQSNYPAKYPRKIQTRFGKQIVLWHLGQMKHISELPDDDAIRLMEMSKRSYDYAPVQP